MNLLKNNYNKISITSFREKQMGRVLYFVDVMMSYLKTNKIPIDYTSIKISYKESKLSKSYRYSGVYHSTMELIVEYSAVIDPITKQSIKLNKPSQIISTYIPKLIDGTDFILNGSVYIPTTYMIDNPISFKKKSIAFESLFCSLILDNSRQKVIILDSFINLIDFLRIFFTDPEIIAIRPDLQPELNLINRHDSIETAKVMLHMTSEPDLVKTLDRVFLDSWTVDLYKRIYGFEEVSIKVLITYALNFIDTHEKPEFIDLKYKRMTFIEQLLKPLFRGVSNIIKASHSKNISGSVFKVVNNTTAITSYFSKEMGNSTLYESTNTYKSLTISKTSYKTPGISMKLPMSVSGIHESYKGIVCPISVSNSNSGETITLTPLTIIDPIYGIIGIAETNELENNSIISSALCSVPFVSSTDSTRLQMACKQLSQSLTHDNCERPYIIGKDHVLLTMGTGVAESDGIVVYSDSRLMVVLYNNSETFNIFTVPLYKHTKDKIVSARRFILEKNTEFKKDELLYEYDSTKNGIVSYGYNLNVAFMPLFGFTCEDAIVISESAAKKCRQRKAETILIPIFPFMTIHKLNKYSKYQVVPDIGESCDPSELFRISIINSNNSNTQLRAIVEPLKRDQYVLRKTMSTTDIIIQSKLTDIKLQDIRIHTNVETWDMDDKSSKLAMEHLLRDKLGELLETAKELKSIFGAYAAELLYRHHIWKNAKPAAITIDRALKLQGVIELTVVSEKNADIGDKFANRYANKGTVSTILPDSVMPRTVSGEKIDYICNPLSVFNRMNYGQLTEGIVSKIIRKCESICLKTPAQSPIILRKLAKLSRIMESDAYADKLNGLADTLEASGDYEDFIASVYDGMYFEAKSFISIDMKRLTEFLKNEFDLNVNESIVIPKELYKYITVKYGADYNVDEDIVIDDIFVTPSYILKLKHLAADKLTARDFGKYSTGTNAPSKAAGQDKASKIGSMEFDGLIASSAIHTIREFRSVKSGSIKMKPGLIEQILDNDTYNLPEKLDTDTILQTVENLIEAVSSKSK